MKWIIYNFDYRLGRGSNPFPSKKTAYFITYKFITSIILLPDEVGAAHSTWLQERTSLTKLIASLQDDRSFYRQTAEEKMSVQSSFVITIIIIIFSQLWWTIVLYLAGINVSLGEDVSQPRSGNRIEHCSVTIEQRKNMFFLLLKKHRW